MLPRRLGLELPQEEIIISANANMLLAALVILGLTSISIAAGDISSLVEQVMPGVVLIKTYDSNGNELGQGSGFVISKDGDVVTCYHVMRGYSSANVTTSDSKEYRVKNVTALNKSDDLARISLATSYNDFNALNLNTTTPKVGQEIIAIGGPLGLEKTVSQGIVSAIRNNTIQITAPISPGSSGGPVFNMNGEVIGIVASQMKYGQNLNFAIPAYLISNMQQPFANEIKELLEPYYPEVESPGDNAPLWKKLGYTSEEELMRKYMKGQPYIQNPTLVYDNECYQQFSRLEKFDDVIQCYSCLIKMNPSYAPAWNSKGVALYRLTRYEEALFCFNKSLEFDPTRKIYLQNKGAALQKLHREAEANATFTKAKEITKYQPIGQTVIAQVPDATRAMKQFDNTTFRSVNIG